MLHADTADEKYNLLRSLILDHNCPSIVYVSRTRRTRELAQHLVNDGIRALPFNGKMEAAEKIKNQNAFMSGDAQVIIATSAFGMGVDKKDVGLVVHYNISDSLENYVQEAGRAGRDPQMQAECFVLYAGSISDWAKDSVARMSACGLIKGQGNNCFAPKATSTRAEAATVLLRLYDLIG